MKKKSYIFLAGHNGLVGSSLLNLLKRKGYKNIITVDKKKLNLRDYKKVKKFFKISISKNSNIFFKFTNF